MFNCKLLDFVFPLSFESFGTEWNVVNKSYILLQVTLVTHVDHISPRRPSRMSDKTHLFLLEVSVTLVM